MQPETNERPNLVELATNVRALLDEDPRRYRNFGVTWFFVKALLKKVFDKEEVPLLGDYEDADVNARLPPGVSAYDLAALALEEYQHNARFNLGRQTVEDLDGQAFTLIDPDMGC